MFCREVVVPLLKLVNWFFKVFLYMYFSPPCKTKTGWSLTKILLFIDATASAIELELFGFLKIRTFCNVSFLLIICGNKSRVEYWTNKVSPFHIIWSSFPLLKCKCKCTTASEKLWKSFPACTCFHCIWNMKQRGGKQFLLREGNTIFT